MQVLLRRCQVFAALFKVFVEEPDRLGIYPNKRDVFNRLTVSDYAVIQGLAADTVVDARKLVKLYQSHFFYALLLKSL